MHALRRAHSLTGCLAPIGPNSLSSLLKSRRATCNRSHDLCDPKASPAGPARDAQERGCRTPSRYPAASSQSERKNRRPSSAASVVGSPTVTGGRQHCGKSRSAARVDRRESAWWDTCTLRIGAASDRPTAAAAGPSCALSRPQGEPPHGTAPVREFKSDARQLWAHERYASSREKTPPIDGFHATTQLNVRDGLAKGRTSDLIDKMRCSAQG